MPLRALRTRSPLLSPHHRQHDSDAAPSHPSLPLVPTDTDHQPPHAAGTASSTATRTDTSTITYISTICDRSIRKGCRLLDEGGPPGQPVERSSAGRLEVPLLGGIHTDNPQGRQQLRGVVDIGDADTPWRRSHPHSQSHGRTGENHGETCAYQLIARIGVRQPPRGGSTRRRDAGGHSRPSRTGSRMLLRSGRRQTQSPITGIRRWPPPGTATPSRLSELSASRSGFTEHTRQTSSSLTISPIIFHPFQEFERTLERRRGYRITSRRTRRRGSSRHVIEPHELNPSELMIQGESRLQRSDG